MGTETTLLSRATHHYHALLVTLLLLLVPWTQGLAPSLLLKLLLL
jgi:hypothetical protein